MAKITVDKDQARITIPSEIMRIKGWGKDTEILISPLFQQPTEELNKDTPVIIKEIKGGKK